MENNNLVIGDWVHSALSDSDIRLDCDILDNILYGYDDGIEPIILTKEILKANKFKSENGVMVYSPDDSEQRYIEIHLRHTGEVRAVEIKNFNRSYNADRLESISVSDFQHALRLCGFTELAANFKIKPDEE